MNIKKVDDKPIVIHTKQKTKLHAKSAPETKLTGENVLSVQRGSKIADERVNADKVTVVKVQPKRNTVGTEDTKTSASQSEKETACPSVNKENQIYARYRQSKKDREKSIDKKSDSIKTLTNAGAKAALDQMEGGNELYDAYLAINNLSRPVENAAEAARNLYRKTAKAREERIKKVRTGKEVGKKAVKESASKVAKETTKKAAKEVAKTTAKIAATTAGTAAGTATTGAGGILIGAVAGESAQIAMDRKDIKNSTRNRMIQLFVAKLKQGENQDSIGKALKDIVMMRFSIMAKYLMRYVGLFLLALFAIVALLALPIVVIITVIYNSPLAIFFPSISSGESTQAVLSAYVAEFNRKVDSELSSHSGYDQSEKVYLDFEGAGTPDNYYDILAVYMVKYGNGDTATDMTDKAKQDLKEVFDDMCSYTITSGTESEEDEEGDIATTTIKYVNVKLKTYHDMIAVYGFDAEEQEMLAELMKPEYLAMLGYSGGGGDAGENISLEQYQAILDSISDENGKKVVEFALSKVGYPYSQDYRDSGVYFDCSSLAYYAWKSAGIDIMCDGANAAASEGKYCYDNNLLVNYDEMQPGDLIFYSYGKNGRFMDITHVAVYVGNGNVVEAANERIGVVYRTVQSSSSIVFIGRPR